MLPFTRRRHALLAAILLVAAAASARAQSDPPDRVARLNYISGQVSFRPATLEEWGAATINYPLTTGDHLWTERDSAAELHVGSTVIRLAPETAFSFLDLDNDVVQTRLAEGTLDLNVREMPAGEAYEIDTPNVAITILGPGTYHVDVSPAGDRTCVTVRVGQVDVDGNGRTFFVHAGQMAEIIGVEDVAYDLGRAPSPDRWELWCRDRDRREDDRVALNYVSRDMEGYEDLDDYGTWSYVPEYGYAWQPTVVAVDWAPYRYGHWSWVRPWGWTWIDDARWGFAPFHYGRWTSYHDRWVWLPGHRSARPVWAPALVAFVGGRNWNFSFGIGMRPAVAWFPLGPGELYCPSSHASPRYLRNVNARNVNLANINFTNVNVANLRYANRDVAGATTAVPREMFVASQSVHRVGVAVPRNTAQQVPVVGHAVAVAPDATSVIGRVPVNAPKPPSSVMRRAVVARNEPPEAARQAAPVTSLPRRAEPRTGRPTSAAADSRNSANGLDANAAASRQQGDDGRGRAAAGNEGGTANGDTNYYVVPRNNQSRGWSPSNRPTPPTARPRNDQATTPGRTVETPQSVDSPRGASNNRASSHRDAQLPGAELPRPQLLVARLPGATPSVPRRRAGRRRRATNGPHRIPSAWPRATRRRQIAAQVRAVKSAARTGRLRRPRTSTGRPPHPRRRTARPSTQWNGHNRSRAHSRIRSPADNRIRAPGRVAVAAETKWSEKGPKRGRE